LCRADLTYAEEAGRPMSGYRTPRFGLVASRVFPAASWQARGYQRVLEMRAVRRQYPMHATFV
jgi:hypothetical protein